MMYYKDLFWNATFASAKTALLLRKLVQHNKKTVDLRLANQCIEWS